MENIFGTPPTPEELENAHSRMDKLQLENLTLTLDGCMSAGHLGYINGTDELEVRRQARDKEIIAVQIDEVRHFIPTWQFDQTDDGKLVTNQKIMELFNLWGKDWWDVIGFCSFVGVMEFRGTGRTIAELVKQPDLSDAWQREIHYAVQSHGINYT